MFWYISRFSGNVLLIRTETMVDEVVRTQEKSGRVSVFSYVARLPTSSIQVTVSELEGLLVDSTYIQEIGDVHRCPCRE